MMAACAETVEKGGILLAEAGTGTGKTFAYLIPLILSGKKAIVSTKTINLQGQVLNLELSLPVIFKIQDLTLLCLVLKIDPPSASNCAPLILFIMGQANMPVNIFFLLVRPQ
jgi:Rad3-related DNA helicase